MDDFNCAGSNNKNTEKGPSLHLGSVQLLKSISPRLSKLDKYSFFYRIQVQCSLEANK